MSSGNNDRLNRLAEAITDEVGVDWATETRDHPELDARLPSLRLLARIGEVYQGAGQDPIDSAFAGAHWGSLQIHEKLGEGSYGTVYRAHDPRLRRDVALKLLRPDLAADRHQARRLLAEARLMARVRHRNVVVIHGADEHNGQIGFWTDLVSGEVLEQRIAGGEIMGEAEAALCGMELCRALGAVHGAGLVHGDVKAANVMRDSEGRFVLMDFGAGSDLAAGLTVDSPVSGTPLALAPELLAGGAASPAADIYALGVLLYRLVTGRYPFLAETLADLRREKMEGAHTPLLDLRPDLGTAFVQAIHNSLAPDPARRFQSAGELEAALAATLQTDGAAAKVSGAGRRRLRTGFLAMIGLTCLVVTGLILGVGRGQRQPTESGSVVAPLTASASLLRTGGEVNETLAEGALVRPGDTLGLTLQLGADAYVYVLNEGQEGEIYVLFPLAESELRNPLPRGRSLRLPGMNQNTVLDWQVTEGQGPERFLVIAAIEPLHWLEEQFAGYDAPTRHPDGHSLPFAADPLHPERGVGAVAGSRGPDKETSSVLDALAGRLATGTDKHSGVWIYQLILYNLGR